MKKVLAFVLMLVLALTTVVTATADGYAYSGVVISTNLSVRTEPRTNAKRITRIHNGKVLSIVGDSGQWMTIDLNASGLGDGYGYVLSDMVKESPCFIVLTQLTNAYDDPWVSKKNGQFSAGEPRLLKNTTETWYVVQTQPGQAGSSFIRRRDVGTYSQEGNYAVTMEPLTFYDYHTGNPAGSVEKFTVVQVLEWDVDWTHVYLDGRDGWLATSHIGPVVN